ncbi:acetyl-CoA C-acetyltransferase [Frankia sp. AiPs1]|uniref:acetyl-CoA C-acetyltransferase n=1 Tax=Frankia sp. AiPs1 TaxID=573493 RepID=UPI002042D699|nr:acetyl-CoA C-acetyltransferase [Frankia sp. AiPs1]MCM3923632.1 acetyl-CoA C-acetyltransferase [Frankia sp. AiPs1]
MSEAWILDGVRSPRGKGRPTGALHHVHPQELLGQLLRALADRVGVDPELVDDVVMGNGNAVGDHGGDVARMAVLAAGWPQTVAGVTLNRWCGSGQQAVTFAATGVASGHQGLVFAGGVDVMSRWPAEQGPMDFSAGNPAVRARFPQVPQGVSADLIATIEGFTRDDVDAFAARSQQRAAAAIEQGHFARSVVPIVNADGSVALDHDEHPRPGTTPESLAKLAPSFAALGRAVFTDYGYDRAFGEMVRDVYPDVKEVDYVHHAGNSSGIVDGAAVLAIASPAFARAHGLRPRARVVMSAVVGAEPVIMLTAPGPASRRCLERAGMTVGDIDLWEINEAFAAVPLKTMRDLELDPEKVNVNGGAIALGHPIGATGGMLLQTALDELERRDLSTALVTMCTGGGMGTATIIERI